MKRAMHDYGRSDLVLAHLGLTAETGAKIAAIISFAGAIEHYANPLVNCHDAKNGSTALS